MKTDKSFNYIRAEFDGAQDLKDYLNSYVDPESKGRNSFYHYSFCGYSYAETEDALLNGWPEGSAEISIISDGISGAMAEADTHSIQHDVTGQFIDIGRYLSGEPECFGSVVMEPQPQEEIKIVVSASFRGNVSDKIIRSRGAAITALIDELQKTHFVKLQFRFDSEKVQGLGVANIVNIDMRNTYSRDTIAFFAAHPGAHRRLIFVAKELLCGVSSLDGCGYGKSTYGYTLDWRTPPKGTIYFPSFDNIIGERDYGSIEAATRTIQAIIDKVRGC